MTTAFPEGAFVKRVQPVSERTVPEETRSSCDADIKRFPYWFTEAMSCEVFETGALLDSRNHLMPIMSWGGLPIPSRCTSQMPTIIHSSPAQRDFFSTRRRREVEESWHQIWLGDSHGYLRKIIKWSSQFSFYFNLIENVTIEVYGGCFGNCPCK